MSILESPLYSGESRRLWQKMCIRESCGYIPAVKRSDLPSNVGGWAITRPVGSITGITTKFLYTVPTAVLKFDDEGRDLGNWTVIDGAGIASVKFFSRNGTNYLLTASYWDGSSTETDSRLYQILPGFGSMSLVSRVPTHGAYAWEVCPIHQGGSTDNLYVVANFVGKSKVRGAWKHLLWHIMQYVGTACRSRQT